MLCTSERMLVGVTGDALLKKKAHAEFLQTYEERVQNVKQFCFKVDAGHDPSPYRDGRA